MQTDKPIDGMMRKVILILILLSAPTLLMGQTDYIYLKGAVKCKGKGVPYASLQLKGTSIGVSCNDAGEYLFKVPQAHADDTVEIRSVGYTPAEVTVAELRKKGNVELKTSAVTLREVKIKTFRSGKDLLQVALSKVAANYHKDTSHSTFYYRDWRAVNGELFLFDEAIIRLSRIGYSNFDDKKIFKFDYEKRELDDNYRMLLKHRLLVYDPMQLIRETGSRIGVSKMLEYSDNEQFFDPVYTPEATWLLADRWLKQYSYAPIMEFEDNGVRYYQVRAMKGRRRIEYIIRRSDHAIVKITSISTPSAAQRVPNQEWVNIMYNQIVHDVDSSIFTYEIRDGHYTLTRYYNNKVFRLVSHHRFETDKQQTWQFCKDWVLTDFSLKKPTDTVSDTLDMYARPLGWMFKASDYTSDYWGKYNSIAVDTLPLRLLDEKLRKVYHYENK